MTNPLDLIWSSFNTSDSYFTPETADFLPDGAFDLLLKLGLLVPMENSDCVVCTGCHERHVEQVIAFPRADGTTRFMIPCPESGSVEVHPDEMRQWTVSFGGMAKAVAGYLGLPDPLVVVPNRLWRIGKVPFDGLPREVFLVRGLEWDDAAQISSKIGRYGNPIVLTAQFAPPEPEVSSDGGPSVIIPLARVASLDENTLTLDLPHMLSLVRDAYAEAEAHRVLPLDPRQKKLVVRQQLMAQLRSHHADEALVAAYREYPSYRKAAEVLTERMKTPIGKDKVRLAVQRHGGPTAVLRDGDSGSLTRTVVTQRRGRTGRILHHHQ